VQKILPHAKINLNYVDIRDLSLAEQNNYMKQVAARNASEAIPLDQAPLLRLEVLRPGESSYLFLYTPHHIISDGWSNARLMQELVTIYSVLSQGGTVQLPTPTVSYIDYVAWEQQWLQSKEYKSGLEYWKQQFKSLPEPLRLPADRAQGSKPTHQGKMFKFSLTPEWTTELHRFCMEQQLTPFHFCLTALYTLLYRYSGQDDIVVGIPVANRGIEAYRDVLGLMLNTLPYRTKIKADDSFLTLALQVKENSEANLAQQKVPFDKIVSNIDIERNLQTTPLFRVLFTFQNIPSLYHVEQIKIEPYKVDIGLTKFDLNFWVEEFNGAFNLTLTASDTLFSEAMIEHILEHYLLVLHSTLSNPQQKIEEVDFLTEEEKRVQLSELISSGTPIHSIKELFELGVAAWPERIAVECGGESMSYYQLNIKANQLAHFLLRENPTKRPIAIFAGRSLNVICAVLAAIKSGTPYVPIDHKLPKERIQYILNDSEAELVMSEELMGDILSRDIVGETVNPQVITRAEDILYIIYTSGTSGCPKGVCIPHRAVANYVGAVNRRVGFGGEERYACVSTLAADLGNTMVFPALMNGGTLLLATDDEILSSTLLSERFRLNPPDYLKIVPSHLRALWDNGSRALPKKGLILGGEIFPIGLANEIRHHSPQLAIYNHYGPTETCIGTTMYRIEGGEEEIPIGIPLDNT
jgi:non-ribosomal peptide synthetase component F